VLEMIDGDAEFDYSERKLSAITFYPSDRSNLCFCGDDVLQMDNLSAALHFVEQSADYGQAQGGSLYFTDLGCAILQFESASRAFVFFAREYDPGEPLKQMTPRRIEAYYFDTK
jgi:hypothetical protein